MEKNTTKLGRREYVDSDGGKYRFDCDSFKNQIRNLVLLNKSNSEGKCKITQVSIMEQLGDKIAVSSETIKKWTANNGPSDLDKVKDCAEFFCVDYHDLLSPCENTEVKTLKENEKNLIKTVYKEIGCIAYDLMHEKDRLDGMNDAGERRIKYTEVKMYVELKLRKIHKDIDTSRLGIDRNIIDKLHRLVIESYFLLYKGYVPDRWENEIKDSGIPGCKELNTFQFELNFLDYHNRKDAILDNNGYYYIYDELEYAEKLGYYDNKYPDEKKFDNDYDEAYLNYGAEFNDIGYEVKPREILMDHIHNVLDVVFDYDFPGIDSLSES